MSRTFEHFPKDSVCPLCGTNEDKECYLVPIDGTGIDRICEGQPMHVACLTKLEEFRYNRNVGVIYLITKEKE